MKSIFIAYISFTFLFYNCVFSQSYTDRISGELEGMFSRLRENLTPAEKLAVNDSVILIVEEYAASDLVFKHRFSNLRYLGQIVSPDSLLKILTWNLILADGGNRYFCYFIKKQGPGVKNKVYKLSALYNEATVISDTIYSDSNWYGALYYDIRPFASRGETHYIILGIDYGNSFITRKLIDVLSFGPGNSLIFGERCFTDGKKIMPRVVFEFAATVVMSLKFNTDFSIVFDHLSPISPEYKDNRQFYGPDFSFDSYYLENGLWRLKQDIDIRNEEQ